MKNDDLRQKLVENIVASLKENRLPWRKRWNSSFGMPRNFRSKRMYSGVNVLNMFIATLVNEYASNSWGTAKSVTDYIGAHVKKGNKATQVFFMGSISKKKKNEVTGEEKEDKFFLIRTYAIFNMEQFQAPTAETLLDGRGRFSLVKTMLDDKSNKRDNVTTKSELMTIAKKYLNKKQMPNSDMTREEIADCISKGIAENLSTYSGNVTGYESNKMVDSIIKGFNPKIIRDSKAAYYPSQNKIGMPLMMEFVDLDAYYSTLLHELGHWVIGNKLVKLKEVDPQHQYAYEELVVELAACFTCYELGVAVSEQPREDTIAYVQNWAKKIGDDPKYIFSAASSASEIANLMLRKAGVITDIDDEENDEAA